MPRGGWTDACWCIVDKILLAFKDWTFKPKLSDHFLVYFVGRSLCSTVYFIFPKLSCTNGSQGEKPKLLQKRSEGNKSKQKLHTVNPFHLYVLFIGDLLLTFLFPFLATNWLKCIWEWDRVKSLLTDPNVFLLQIKNENTPSSYFQSKWTWQIIEKGNSEREMYYLLSEW